ncbi:hypothetical protein EGI26_01200 [Lacihabitans sp. CCS-44]|uniref:hypothetical protein n=1 Tax=Lacihabitans sp. CCS-44 TaxID=2487331 RepID=UPI0020CBA650|nr:hypothetical protein [Lacihabitans sp. CCS-44]MCP9753780.1 hypothetical protein [Lacihabitans sp. CCS-44]
MNLQKKTLVFILFVFLSLDKTQAQSFSYDLQSSALSFDYSNLNNFTSPRTIPKAFTLNIRNSNRGKYNVFCKIVSNSNENFGNIPLNLFSVKVNSANFTISSSYYTSSILGLSDVIVGNVTGRARKTDTIYYDLILNPIGFNYDPNNYNYSFIFTVTEY